MGAWGINIFENDDALDWLDDFCHNPSEDSLTEAFVTVNQVGDDYLESPESSEALVAAEIVAALKSSPSSDLPEDVKECIGDLNFKPSDDLIANSLTSIRRVKSDSELKELWEETEDFSEWNKVIDNLIERLES